MAENTSSRLGALALVAAGLVIVATAGSAPVASKGVRRTKKPKMGLSSAAAATATVAAPASATIAPRGSSLSRRETPR